MIGNRDLTERIWRTRSSPLRPGSFMSVITRSRGSLCARIRPVSPRPSTRILWPSSVRTLRSVMTIAGSSSTRSILPAFFILSPRQHNTKSCAAIHLRLILQRTPMSFHNPCRDRQPQPRAGFLRGKERIEKPFLDFRRDSFAGVGDLENDNLRIMISQPFVVEPRAEGDGSILPNAVGGILHQVNEHLFHLLRVDANTRIY